MRPRGQLQPAIAWATKVETEECVLVPPFAVSWTPGGTAANVIDMSSGRIVRIFRKHKAPILHVTAGDDACFTACADGKALYWTCKDAAHKPATRATLLVDSGQAAKQTS